MQCFKPYPCNYWEYCTKALRENIKGGMRTNQKLDLYKEGIITYEDIIDTNINLKYKQQAEIELYNEVVIKKMR